MQIGSDIDFSDESRKFDLQIKERNGGYFSIGYIYRGEFRKTIQGSKHIYDNTYSLGIDAEMFNGVIRKHCEHIKIYDEETGILYVTRVSVFDKLKDYNHFPPHRAQVFLRIKHFNQLKRDENGRYKELEV